MEDFKQELKKQWYAIYPFSDMSIDDNGKTTGLIVEKHRFLLSYFTNKKEMVVKWEQIEKIGEDVILVNIVY